MTATSAPFVPDVGHELSGLLDIWDWFSRDQRRNNDHRVGLATGLTWDVGYGPFPSGLIPDTPPTQSGSVAMVIETDTLEDA